MTETYTPSQPIWCAGCGHYGVQGALAGALSKLGIAAHETMLLTGIGCSGSVQNNIETYGYHAMHGRVLPTAVGAAVANPDLTVIAAGGDGDGSTIAGRGSRRRPAGAGDQGGVDGGGGQAGRLEA